MAFKEVELTEEERASAGAKFFKFEAIGAKLTGRFVRTQPQTGQYAKAGAVDYVFRTKEPSGAIVEVVLNPPADLSLKLKKAALTPGRAVAMTYERDLDVGKESPMKIIKLLVDDTPMKPAPAAAPPKAPPPAPAPEDDIDF